MMRIFFILFGVLFEETFSSEERLMIIRHPIKTSRHIDPVFPVQVKGGYPIVKPESIIEENKNEKNNSQLEELIVDNNSTNLLDFRKLTPQQQENIVPQTPIMKKSMHPIQQIHFDTIAAPISYYKPPSPILYPIPAPKPPIKLEPFRTKPPIKYPTESRPHATSPVIIPTKEPLLTNPTYPTSKPPSYPTELEPSNHILSKISQFVEPNYPYPPDHNAGIIGVGGTDYPIYNKVPVINFRCSNVQYPGYYAVVETRCQVFVICQADGRQDAFLCPNATVFQQKYFVCDWWYNVDCDSSPNFYHLNSKIGQVSSYQEAKPSYSSY